MITKELFALVVLSISSIELSSQWSLENMDQACANLYGYTDKNGVHVKIQNSEQILDFSSFSTQSPQPPPPQVEVEETTEPEENELDIMMSDGEESPEPIAIEISQSCKLTVCNDTNLQGTCAAVSNNVTNKELAETEFTIMSASCECEKVCNCEDVILRRTECARAYIDKTCNVCNTQYTDMRPGEIKNFPTSFRDRISSIVVRDGCKLTTFSEPDYKGVSTPIKSKIRKNIEQDIGSYKCTCPAAAPSTPGGGNQNQPRPSHFPPMINVPNTPAQVNALLNQRGDRHSGLISALRSMKNKRSGKNAYILLLGLTGAGKSTTINFLFDNPTIAKVGDVNSTTTDINEYQIPIPIDELGITNSQLRVIDTPGLVDTRGLEQDAKFMATLDQYLSTHEELKKYKPNVILIFAKFNDNRFSGDGASFVKMLRAIDVFRERIMGKKFSNVIIVLTHYMSETQGTTRNPTKRLAAIEKVVEEYSQFPKPTVIVVAENKPQEESLTMVNGFYKLPNGDYYPRNLFDQIQKATVASGDPIGEAIIRTAFKKPDAFIVTKKTTSLLDVSGPKVIHYLGVLSDIGSTPGLTEISELLQKSFDELDAPIKTKYPDTLSYLQRTFFNRQILTKKSVPSTTTDVAKFFREIRSNPAILKVLESALGLTLPFFPNDYVAGRSYNLVQDKTESLSPFNLEKSTPAAEIGFSLPEVLSCTLQNSVRTTFSNYNSREEYVNARLVDLGVDGAVQPTVFAGEVKAGKNVLDKSDINSVFRLNALIEYQTFQLSLNDKPALNDRFTNSLRELSLVAFDQSNFQAVQRWNSFFTNFGSHVVQSAFGGGSLEIRLEYHLSENFTAIEILEARKEITQSMFEVVQVIEDSMIGRTGNSSTTLESLPNIRLALRFRGGDYKYHLRNISDSEASEILEKWRDSISLQPVMLENGISLLPISQVLKKAGQRVNSSIYENMEAASRALLNSSLVYHHPPQGNRRYSSPPVGRENTNWLPDTSGSSGSMEQFMSLFQAMSAATQAAQDKFLDMWQKMADSQKLIEETRRKEEVEQKRIEKEEKLAEDLRKSDLQEKEKDRDLQRQILQAQMDQEERREWAAQLATQREAERQNRIIAQQESARQQEIFMQYIMQQNQQVADAQQAALANRPPSLLSEIGGFIGKVTGPIMGAFSFLG